LERDFGVRAAKGESCWEVYKEERAFEGRWKGRNLGDREELKEILLDRVKPTAADVRSILRRGVDVDTADKHGRIALTRCSSSGDEEAVRELLEWGADVNTSRENGWNALMGASYWGNVEIAKLLLERGANINAAMIATVHGRAPLHWAAERGELEVVNLLLEEGADHKAEDNKGETALAIARVCGHQCVEKLLQEWERK